MGETPQYKGIVIKPLGLMSCPSTSCPKVGNLPYATAVDVSELFVDDLGNTWGKLLHTGIEVETHWFKVIYNGIVCAELELIEEHVDIRLEPPVDCDDAMKAAEKIAKIKQIDETISYLEKIRDEILWDNK